MVNSWSAVPVQFPTAYLVSLVQELVPEQTVNVQLSQSGGCPSKTLAKEDLPTPVAPMMTKWGSGIVRFWA